MPQQLDETTFDLEEATEAPLELQEAAMFQCVRRLAFGMSIFVSVILAEPWIVSDLDSLSET